jgi:anti-sigma regulatory factor (Ser/Thr protein kinase)
MKCPDIQVDVLSKPKLLRSIRELVRCYVMDAGFSSDTADGVVLAVDEACTNAIRHSYAGSCEERLQLLLQCREAGIEIVLRDQGEPAPARRIAHTDVPTPDPSTLKPGGLGVKLIFQVFDEVQFRPGADRGNEVVMRLKRREGAAEGPESDED